MLAKFPRESDQATALANEAWAEICERANAEGPVAADPSNAEQSPSPSKEKEFCDSE